MQVDLRASLMVYVHSLYLLTLATVASSSDDDFQTPKSNKKRFLKVISSQDSPQSKRARSVGPITGTKLIDRTIRSQSVARLGMTGLPVLPLTRKNKLG
jgi:hypothetical protein